MKATCRFLVLTWTIALSASHVVGQEKQLGWLSARHEVGNRGPETISPGKFKVRNKETGEVEEKEDKGGKSYGSYQFASKRGIDGSSAKAFVETYYPEDFRPAVPGQPTQFQTLEPGSAAFDRKWTEVVKREGELFRNNEHEFIYETHYLPVVNEVKKTTGLDVAARGSALQNVAWSVAVQHGPSSDPKGHAAKLLARAVGKWKPEELAAREKGVSDKDLIRAVYDERQRKKEDGSSVYFGDLDLSKRFRQERADALDAQLREQDEAEAPDLNKTKLGQAARNMGIRAGPTRRKPKELTVERGQTTFNFSGYDRDFATTRKPAVPFDRSGVRIGRGYDLGRLTYEQASQDLEAAGFSPTQTEVFAKAAGLRGEAARAYLDGFTYSRLSTEAKEKGLQGTAFNQYIRDHMPNTISLAQQQKLFERSYDRAEKNARSLFPEYDRFPIPAREAIADMIFDLGPEELAAKRPGFVSAVRQQDWAVAAVASKRNGAGVERNQTIRQKLDSAAAEQQRK